MRVWQVASELCMIEDWMVLSSSALRTDGLMWCVVHLTNEFAMCITLFLSKFMSLVYTVIWQLPQRNHARVCEFILFGYKYYMNASYVNIKVSYSPSCNMNSYCKIYIYVQKFIVHSFWLSSSLLRTNIKFWFFISWIQYWNILIVCDDPYGSLVYSWSHGKYFIISFSSSFWWSSNLLIFYHEFNTERYLLYVMTLCGS